MKPYGARGYDDPRKSDERQFWLRNEIADWDDGYDWSIESELNKFLFRGVRLWLL
jgi:hypothetical protein